MGLGSIFGSSKVKKVDTSVQDAEIKRQYELLLAQAEERRLAEIRAAEERRAADERRTIEQHQAQQAENARIRAEQTAFANETRAAQQAEAQRQRDWQNDQAAQARAAADAVEARRQQEADAVEAAAAERAGRVREYSTGRQDLIDKYTADIASAFSGFDDAYFDTYKQNYVAAARPKLEQQYDDDHKKLVYAFTNSGNLDSTAAADRFGRLDQLQTERQARVASGADDSAMALRDSIEGTKNDSLATAFASGSVGREDLADGVTDVSGELGGIGSKLSGLAGDVRRKATSVKAPSFSGDSLSDLAMTFNAPNAGGTPYGRFGGNGSLNQASLGRASYVVN